MDFERSLRKKSVRTRPAGDKAYFDLFMGGLGSALRPDRIDVVVSYPHRRQLVDPRVSVEEKTAIIGQYFDPGPTPSSFTPKPGVEAVAVKLDTDNELGVAVVTLEPGRDIVQEVVPNTEGVILVGR